MPTLESLGYVPQVFDDSLELFIGIPGIGRATASSTTLDLVQFSKLPGQSVRSTFTLEDVGMPIAIVGGGPVDPLMPDIWGVQGALFHTTIAAYVSPTQVTLADAPDTSFYNTGFCSVICYRRCLIQLDKYQWAGSIAPGTRDTLRFTSLGIYNPYIERFGTIALGQPIYLRSSDPDVGDIFGGWIDRISAANLVGTSGTFSWECNCASWAGLATRRIVPPALPNTFDDFGDIVFKKAVLYYLSDEGVSAFADSASEIVIQAPVGTYVNDILDSIVQQLSTATETWYWYAGVWREFYLRKRTTVAAPWDVDGGADLFAGSLPVQIKLTGSHDRLATFVYTIGSQVLLGDLHATIVGNGAQRNFDLPNQVAVEPVITLNGNPQTVGISGVDTGKDWYYTQGSKTLVQDSGGTILTAADELLVVYAISYAGVASAPNYLNLVERNALEGTSGVYDHAIQVSTPISNDDLLATTETYASQYGTPPRVIEASTLKPGLKPGMLQHIRLPQLNVDDDFLIATVNMSTENKVIRWDYTAFNGANTGNGLTALAQFINRGKNTLALTKPLVAVTAGAHPGLKANTATGSGAGVAFPSAVTIGNLLLVVAGSASLADMGEPITVSDTLGNVWTEVQHISVSGFPSPLRLAIAYAIANASGSTTVAVSGAGEVIISEFTGIDKVNPVDVSASNTSVPTITTTSESIVITAVGGHTSTPTATLPEQILAFFWNSLYGDGTGAAWDHLTTPQTFTSSIVPGAGGVSPVFCCVAFKVDTGTRPPAETVPVYVNPSGTVTHTGGLTADEPLFGNGSADVKVGTKTGDTAKVVTSDGAVSDGAVLIYDASGNATGLTVGADGDVLKVVAGAPVWGTGGGGGGALVLLEQHTASASASLEFTAWRDDSLYDEYMIEVVGLVSDTPAIQFSTNGGSSYDTGSNYAYNGAFGFNSATGQYGSNSTTSFPFRNGNTTLSTYGSWNGSLKLFGVSLLIWPSLTGQVQWNDNSLGIVSVQLVANYNNILGATNAFRVLPLSSVLVAGTIRVYGISK